MATPHTIAPARADAPPAAEPLELSAPAADWLKALPATAGRAPARADTDRITLPAAARRGLQSFVRHLVDQGLPLRLPAVSRLIVYGSYARGDFEDGSDVDLAVVLAGQAPEEDKAGQKIRLGWDLTSASGAALSETWVDVQLMVLWESELSAPQEQANPGYCRNILKDGIELTAAL